MTRDRLAFVLLVPLFVCSLYGTVLSPWHAASSIDSRTHIEMIAGISQNGLPYLHNGPVADYPELQGAWNVARGDRLWGTYPPVFPYVASVFFKVGGLRAVGRLSMALISLLTLGAFALGRRYTRNPLLGTATAYVTLGTSAAASALDIGPYMLAVTLITWAAYFAIVAIDETRSRALLMAFLSGLIGGLASGTHLLTFPMLAGLLFVLGTLPVEGSPPLIGSWSWSPTRASLARGAFAGLGAAIPLFAMGALNHARFGSWNPASYGPCVWRRCLDTGLGKQSLGAMIGYAAPVIAWLACTIALGWLLRKSRIGLALTFLASLAVMGPESELRHHAFRLFVMVWGYVVDLSDIDMKPMVPAASGPGTLWGPWVVKSTLQSAPALALAFLAPFTTRRDKLLKIALFVPVLGIYALLALRANLPAVHALGFPLLYLRYVMPALPLLAVLSVAAVAELPWRRLDIGVGAAVGIGAIAYLWSAANDLAYARRVLICWVTLASAVAAVLFLYLARKKATTDRAKYPANVAAMVAFVLGPALTIGIDLPVTYMIRDTNDLLVDDIAKKTPQRFALVGYGGDIDIPLTLRATRDLEYADLYEGKDWGNFRSLIDVWTKDGRPVYALWPAVENRPKTSPWPDVSFEVIDADRGLVLLQKKK